MAVNKGSSRPDSLSIFDGVRRLFAHFRERAGDAYIERSENDALQALYDDLDTPLDHKLLLTRFTCHIILCSLIRGDLQGHFSDGLESCDVPGWAWEFEGRTAFAWGEGRLPLDVFLPDSWQRWSCSPVYLRESAFGQWMQEQCGDYLDSWPELPDPYDIDRKPAPLKMRPPSDAPFITLSEALTWIAFGFALDRDSLDRAISGNAFDAIDPHAALSAAIAKLAVRASDGQIAMRGKYIESHSTDKPKVDTKPIDPVRFEDFAQFDILYDGLRYGTGLTWEKENSTLNRVAQDRRDAFRCVKVRRADLMKFYPPEIDNTRALLSVLPASLPDIGPIIGMEEALSWLAHGKPSDDVQLWQNALGWMQFRFSTGETFNVGEDSELPEHHLRYREANRALWNPLQDGNLSAYVEENASRSLAIPRHYWNQVDPAHLDHVYRGMSDTDGGRGCPVLLSRKAFDEWRRVKSGSQNCKSPVGRSGVNAGQHIHGDGTTHGAQHG